MIGSLEILNYPLQDITVIIVSFCSILYTAYCSLNKLNDVFHFVETKKSKLDSRLDKFDVKLDDIASRLCKNETDTDALKDASISRIKGKIVDRHKEFMAQGSIDYKTLDYIQQQFRAYERLGGNSYVHDLVKDLEGLPLVD